MNDSLIERSKNNHRILYCDPYRRIFVMITNSYLSPTLVRHTDTYFLFNANYMFLYDKHLKELELYKDRYQDKEISKQLHDEILPLLTQSTNEDIFALSLKGIYVRSK